MPTDWKNKDADELANTLAFLEREYFDDPKVGPKIKRAIKEKHPEANFAELELEDRLTSKEKELDQRISNFEKLQSDKENKAFWDAERKRVRETYDLNDEDMAAVQKHMIDNHVGSMEIAARDYTNFVKAPAEPTNYQERTGIQLPGFEGLMKDPSGWANQEAFKALNEIEREGRRGR